MTTLLWKELRQNRLTVTLIPLALMLFIALSSLTRYNSLIPIYAPVFCAIFSALIGGCMFAPEYAARTSTFLDYQPLKKRRIWTAKFIFGAASIAAAIALVFLEAIVVCKDPIVEVMSSRFTWVFVASCICFFLYSSSFFYSGLVSNSMLAVLLGIVVLCPCALLGQIANIFMFPYYRGSLPQRLYGETLLTSTVALFSLFFLACSLWSVVKEQVVWASNLRRTCVGLIPIGMCGLLVVCVGLYSYLDWGFVSPSEVWSVNGLRASPNGKKIAFSIGGPYGVNRVGRIWVLDVETGQLQKLTQFRGSTYGPISGSPWSRDGSKLLYCLDSRSTVKMFLSELHFPLVNRYEWSKSSVYVMDITDRRATEIVGPSLVGSLKWQGNDGIVFSTVEGQKGHKSGGGSAAYTEPIYTWSRKTGLQRKFQISIDSGYARMPFIVGWRSGSPIIALHDTQSAQKGWALRELRVYEEDGAYRTHGISGKWSVGFLFRSSSRTSPDGKKVILYGSRNKLQPGEPCQVAVFDLLSQELKVAAIRQEQLRLPQRIGGAVFSSDSKWFSYTSTQNGVTRVWLVDVQACETNLCLELAKTRRQALLSFSPGSSHLLVVSGRAISNVVTGPCQLWLIDPSTRAVKQILADLGNGPLDLQSDLTSVDWLSEDSIGFSTARSDIWTVNLDGSNLRRVFPPGR